MSIIHSLKDHFFGFKVTPKQTMALPLSLIKLSKIMCPYSVAETWRRIWGRRKNCFAAQDFWMTFFSGKMSIFRVKISDDRFLVIDLAFRIFFFFPQIFRIFAMLKVVNDPFLTRKTHFLLCWYFQTHPTTLLLKILGVPMHGRPPTSNFFGDRPPSPPRSPPLSILRQLLIREKHIESLSIRMDGIKCKHNNNEVKSKSLNRSREHLTRVAMAIMHGI